MLFTNSTIPNIKNAKIIPPIIIKKIGVCETPQAA